MSHVNDVTRLIGELGHASCDDLVPFMPHLTRKQILKAINNATQRRLIECLGRLPRTNRFPVGVFVVAEGEPVRHRPIHLIANSVFQLGDRAAQGARP